MEQLKQLFTLLLTKRYSPGTIGASYAITLTCYHNSKQMDHLKRKRPGEISLQ